MVKLTNKDKINNAMDDIIKILTRYIIVHILFSCIDGTEDILNCNFAKKILYTIIGLVVYHFIIRDIFEHYKITNKIDNKKV